MNFGIDQYRCFSAKVNGAIVGNVGNYHDRNGEFHC